MRLILCQTRWSGVRRTSFALCTVAAAASGVGVGVTSAPPPLLMADHPFFFAIHEKLSGAILFVGKIATPPSL
jgi:serpin B